MRLAGRRLVVGVLAVSVGCHRYVSVDASVPPVGEPVALDISDEGRVALRDRIGPGVDRIEGRMVGVDGNEYLVSVSHIEQLNGPRSPWAGEVMRLDRGLVDRVQRREVSTTRTLALVGGIAAGVAILIVSGGFDAVFGDDDNGGNGEPPVERRSRPIRP